MALSTPTHSPLLKPPKQKEKMIPQWQGEDITDKSLMVWCDQGLGDSIMLARYIPMIRARRVVLYVDAPIFRLFRFSFPGVETLCRGWAFPKTDYHISFMSLMHIFGLERPEQIPRGRYMHPPKKAFDLPPGTRIGVNWQGNKNIGFASRWQDASAASKSSARSTARMPLPPPPALALISTG